MLTTLSSLGGIIATLSISGSRSRSGWARAAPSAADPMNASSISTNDRPRTSSGRKGTSGSWSIRPNDSHVSGAVSTHARQAFRISVARSIGQSIAPA